jgi:uncharacterized protein DUF6062
MGYKLLEACRRPGCPICRLEQQGVERYLDSQLYENVNSPAWRDHLRASHGFCREHAWLGVNQRLGDALGFSIIYHDIINSVLKKVDDNRSSVQVPRRRMSMRDMFENVRAALTPRKRCPACEHREEMMRHILSTVVEGLLSPEVADALQASEGLCLPHLIQTLETIKDRSMHEKLLSIHREKLESLKTELAEFIRKNDYQTIQEGFGSEGDAWLRAISMIAGSRKGG